MKRLIESAVILVAAVILLTIALCDRPRLTAIESPFGGICGVKFVDNIDKLDKVANEASRVALERPKTAQIGVLASETIEYTSKSYNLSDGELDLIAAVCYAEAENQSELGKRLVIDTILNRLDDSRFPDSVAGIIFAENQFTSVWNGRIDRVNVSGTNVYMLINEELINRTNQEVLYFNTQAYATWATPVLCEGDHYFCK